VTREVSFSEVFKIADERLQGDSRLQVYWDGGRTFYIRDVSPEVERVFKVELSLEQEIYYKGALEGEGERPDFLED